EVIKVSGLYYTKPWGYEDQPEFVNLAVEAETDLSPEELLKRVKTIERALGREDTFRWGPRVVDIDILFYDNLVIETDTLKIPHPYIAERDFVLLPMAEIAPQFVHPTLKKDIKTLLRELNEKRD
ncbi:MAG: 2-amino-4-hydroxy-6-hydroxymethyldihydropteridine diphosphokinase, partial [Nitrospirae bacterium]